VAWPLLRWATDDPSPPTALHHPITKLPDQFSPATARVTRGIVRRPSLEPSFQVIQKIAIVCASGKSPG
jgi:hypothetical protein